MHERRSGLVGGLVLILFGALLLAQQYFKDLDLGAVFLIGLGLIFLVAYIFTRRYGFLIPGCILMGMGIPFALVQAQSGRSGWVVESMELNEGGLIVLGLGLSFITIWLIDLLVARGRPGGWWALIPGSILTLVGLGLLTDNQQWLDKINQWWPLIFVIVGIWIILEVILRRGK
jgi:hypothetical protein